MAEPTSRVMIGVSRTALANGDPADYRIDDIEVSYSSHCATFVQSVLAEYQEASVVTRSGIWFGYLTDKVAKSRLVALFAHVPGAVVGAEFADVAIDPAHADSHLHFKQVRQGREGIFQHQLQELLPFLANGSAIATHVGSETRQTLTAAVEQQPENVRLQKMLATTREALGEDVASQRKAIEHAIGKLAAVTDASPASQWRSRLPLSLITELDDRPGAWLKNGTARQWGLTLDLTDEQWDQL